MIQTDNPTLKPQLAFLKLCYTFVDSEWHHADREPIPDQGFEQRFREYAVKKLPDWRISQEREMLLAGPFYTASGVAHEVDIVANQADLTAAVELKNRPGDPPGKNDVIVFFAKLFDYLAYNPELVMREICPIFMSSFAFQESALAACIGLGIHPIGSKLRPLPMLVENVRLMNNEFESGRVTSNQLKTEFDEFAASVRWLSSTLADTWVSSRCGYYSMDRIILRAVGGLDTIELSRTLRHLNSECTRLLEEFNQIRNRSAS